MILNRLRRPQFHLSTLLLMSLAYGGVLGVSVANPTEYANGERLERCYGWPLPAVEKSYYVHSKSPEVYCCRGCSGDVPLGYMRVHPEEFELKDEGFSYFWPFILVDIFAVMGLVFVAGLVLEFTLERRSRRVHIAET